MEVGFTIGKFAPLHKGHEELIERGLAENDEFYVLINNTDVTDIPLKKRAEWLKEMYPSAHIILGENPPKQYGMDKESVEIQVNYLKDVFKNIPVTAFYSGEEYGKFVAEGMKVKNIKIEKEIPINATKIRNNPEDNKKYMENIVYKDFIC